MNASRAADRLLPQPVPGSSHRIADELISRADLARGLNSAEAGTRLNQHGANNILAEADHNWIGVIKDTAKDPMIWLLLGTAVLFAWTGDTVEAVVLALAILPILGMDAFLHRRTAVSTAALAGQLSATAHVIRDGLEVTIPATAIVPGDIVLVAASESIPVDGALIAGGSVQIDESALTGEALPVHKRPVEIVKPGDLFRDDQWLFAGTRLLTGKARMLAINTGAETFYGQIVRTVHLERQQATQLQRSLNRLVLWLTLAAGAICIALAATRLAQGNGFVDAFVSAATLAVAAMPEEFPVVVAMFLAMGVHRLSQRKALVRRASAVENIGRITVICTDKTGTITEGRLKLAAAVPAAGIAEERLLAMAARASRSDSDDPMDRALLAAVLPSSGAPVRTYPFTEDRRRETAVWRETEGALSIVSKGAPETIMALCRIAPRTARQIGEQVQSMSAQGMKVIACATRSMPKLPRNEPAAGFDFRGLIAFSDPLRKDVSDAVRRAQRADIRVILVTGDHPSTAKAIAREAGIGSVAPRLITGQELGACLTPEKIGSFDIVARATPLHKLELVKALKNAGGTVAVTGDGVNDVPALQGADIGIAMGDRGTRPAREAAAIVLLNDSFTTIINAIEEGRRLFWNLRLSFAYLLMVHIPLVIVAAIIPFAGYPLLFLPLHVVWLELIIHPTAILAFQNDSDARPHSRAPRDFFTLREWAAALCTSLITSVAMLGIYVFALGDAGDSIHARSAGLATLILSSSAVTMSLAGFRNHMAGLIAGVSAVSLVLLTQLPPLARLMSLSPLQLEDWSIAALAALLAGASARNLTRGE